jgi:C1A family cysteine protease
MFNLLRNLFIEPTVQLQEIATQVDTNNINIETNPVTTVNNLKKNVNREERVYRRKKDTFTNSQLSNPKIFNYKKFTLHNKLDNIKSVDLRNKMPPVYNQGKLGSCTANAICAAYEYEMMRQGETDKQMSRLFLYYQERKIEKTIDEDSGAEIKDGVFATASTGICEESLWPYDIDNFKTDPSEEAYLDAGFHKTINYNRIYQRENDIKQSLLDGFPVIFGISVYESFESDEVALTGIVPMPSSNEKLLGGHAILIVGYKEINNKDYFIVRNSWGSTWGDEGYCYILFDYVLNENLAEDFWSIKLVDDEDNK